MPGGMVARRPLHLLALLAGLPLAAQEAAAAARALRFAWPIPCSVEVTEVHEKRARKVVSRYRVELRRAEREGELLVGKRDFLLLEIDGRDVSGPAFRKQLAPMEAQLGIMPDVRIDASGSVIELEAWDAYYPRAEAVVRSVSKSTELTAQAVEDLLRMMRSPQMQEILRSRAAEYWGVWVGAWVEQRDFASKSDFEVPQEFPLPDGSTVETPVRYRYLGPDEAHPGHVALSMESRLHGEAVTKAVFESIKKLAAGTTGAPPVPDDAISAVDIVNDVRVVVRPETMQPIEAIAERRMQVDGKDGARADVERRHYRFAWGK
jgi:hypothetical protein